MVKLKIGIIGGTGLDNPEIFTNKNEVSVTTPYGAPSSSLITGQLHGVDVVLLARHGRQHETNPSSINYRANIHALKEIGCTHVLATNACGSLREEYRVGDLIILDQFIDKTFKRECTFYSGYEGGPKGVMHIPMGHPFCEDTRKCIIEASKGFGFSFHEKGTIVIIEGPRFSTVAESKMFRLWGADLIGMTTVPEVCLAKEAGLCYSAVAMVTDYDSWKEDEPHVSVEIVGQRLRENAEKATKVLLKAVELIAQRDWDDVIKRHKDVVDGSVM